MRIKNFTRLTIVLISLLLFSISCKKDHDENIPIDQLALSTFKDDPVMYYDGPVTLFAGQSMDAGFVTITRNSGKIYVKYSPRNGWALEETHLHIADNYNAIPQTKTGNPKIGKFDFSTPHGLVQDYTYEVMDDFGDCLAVAAHAVVKSNMASIINFELELPIQAILQVQYPYNGAPSYLQSTITGGTLLDGTYNGWCIDTDRSITQNPYTVDVYSSYEGLPAGTVEHPENLDLINWIINQDFVGQPSLCGGNNTYGDVQRVIWTLIDDELSTSGLGQWSQCRADLIIAAALENGEGFVPACNDYIAVVLIPVNPIRDPIAQITIAQVTFIDLQVECDYAGEETAWGDGNPFNGNSWATWIHYCEPVP